MRTRQKKLDEEAATEKMLQDARMKAQVEEEERQAVRVRNAKRQREKQEFEEFVTFKKHRTPNY